MAKPQSRSGLMSDLRSGLLQLNLQAWVRRQPALQKVYRLFPRRLRDRLTVALSSRSVAHVRFERTAAWDFARVRTAAPSTPVAAPSADSRLPGVNILGYIRGEFGLAESARAYARALIDAGAPVALYDVDLGIPHFMGDHSLDAFIDERLPHPVSIVFINPDYLQAALAQVGQERMLGRYVIGCWFWELETIPGSWLGAIDQVDEIMVSSRFVEEAFAKVTDKPIVRVPLPLASVEDSGLQRGDFGLESGKFIFLCTFDFHSFVARKNPYAAIHAFRQAFPPERDDVQLLVKSSNGHLHPDSLRDLLNAAAMDSRILVRDDVIDRAHVHALQRCCDAYISLHRAEGFGLGLAECMALGKPVIATGWSGNMEFMNHGNACLVDYTLVPVREGEYPESAGARWAEADLGSAAAAMRRLADDRDYARGLGESGGREVRDRLAAGQAARKLLERIAAVADGVH